MKKLWAKTRSRSRRRGSQSKDSASHQVKPSSSKGDLSTPNGEVVPPVPTLPRTSLAAQRNASIESNRQGSGNRIQPMLVGVSRPSQSRSRPGTSDSLQNAVTLAADQSSREFVRGHSRTKSPKYIDIFDISNTDPSATTYNEEVAERNLGLKKVAVHNVQYAYVPSSKFQEEVALRNAQSPIDSTPSSQDESRPRSVEPPDTDHGVTNQGPNQKIHSRKRRDITKQSARPRENHRRARELPQMASLGGQQEKPAKAQHNRDVAVSETQAPIEPGQTDKKRDADPTASAKSRTSKATSPAQTARTSGDRSDRKRPASAEETASAVGALNSALANYHLSRAELSHPRPTENTASSRQTPSESSPRLAQSTKSPSTTGTVSSTTPSISLANRKIMDLTEAVSDDAAEGLELPQSQTPEVADARTGPLRRSEPAPVESRSVSRPATSQSHNETDGGSNDLKFVDAADDMEGTWQEDDPRSIERPTSSFSGINTVAEIAPTTPGNEVPADQQWEDGDYEPPAEHADDPIEVSHFAIEGSAASPRNALVPSRLSTVAESEPETEYETPFEVSSGVPVGASSRQSYGKTQEFDDADLRNRPEPSASSQSTPVVKPLATERTPTGASPVQSTPKTIQLSPESLQSRDFIDPSRSFGVLTRDFAETPSRSMPRSDTEPNTSAKVKSPNRSILTASGASARPNESPVPQSSQYSSGFNEEEFRRKQEQARAALIKLQQSLNEEFIPPARPARQGRTTGVKRVPASNSTGHASIPSNPYGPVSPSTLPIDRYDPPRSQEQFSVHEQVTVPTSTHNTSTSSSSAARPSRQRGYSSPTRQPQLPPQHPDHKGKGKGKQKERNIDVALYDLQRTAYEITHRPHAHQQSYFPPVPSHSRRSHNTDPHSPTSPGEVSLSSFPLPSSPPTSSSPFPPTAPAAAPTVPSSRTHAVANRGTPTSPPASPPTTTTTTRRERASTDSRDRDRDRDHPRPPMPRPGSVRSQASDVSRMTSTSAYSIPYHMIPERTSSMRDSLVREMDDEA